MVQTDAVTTLRMENARLQQALEEAQRGNARLEVALDAALAEFAALREESEATRRELMDQIASLAEQVAKGNERIGELLAIAQRKKRKPRAEAPTPSTATPAS